MTPNDMNLVVPREFLFVDVLAIVATDRHMSVHPPLPK